MTATASIHQGPEAAAEWSQRRRLSIWLLVLLGGVTLLIGLFAEYDPAAGHHRRTSHNRRGDGFFALYQVLSRLGLPVDRHYQSYGRLPDPGSTLLLSLDPLHAGYLNASGLSHMDKGQVRQLRRWVEAGGAVLGTLPGRNVVLLAGREIELQGFGSLDEDLDPLLAVWPGAFPATLPAVASGRIHGRPGFSPADSVLDAPEETARVAAAFTASAEPGTGARIQVFDAELPAGVRVEVSLDDAPLVVSAAVGEGRVYLASTALPFCNYGLGRLRTGELTVALVRGAADAGRRRILFDEYVHGLGEDRGLWWWALNSDLRFPLFGILLLALGLAWRGGFRLGSPRPVLAVQRRAVEEFVVSLADLSHRGGRRREAAGRILATYAARLRGERRGPRRGDESEWPPELMELASECRAGDHFGPREFQEFALRAEQAYRAASSTTNSTTISTEKSTRGTS